MTARRQIFALLRRAAAPLTMFEIRRETGLSAGSVANTCSFLEAEGIVHRPNGTRRGYALARDMLPEDQLELDRLVALYGAPRIKLEVSLRDVEARQAQRVDELADLYRHDYGEMPDFMSALRVLVVFLDAELGEGWPLHVLCTDGERDDDQGRRITHGWAFAVLSSDTTSYLHTEDGGRVEWYGTTWEPGCECDDPPDDSEHAGYSLHATGEHLPGCPAARE